MPEGAAVHRWGAPVERAALGIVAVHGRGQDPGFLREAASFGIDAHVIAPVAPGKSWYPHPFLQPLEGNRAGLEGAIAAVERCIAELHQVGLPPERIALWGFSQGACVLSHLLLTRAPSVAGAALWTGGFVGQDPLPAPGPSALAGLRIVLRSISDDPWVPRRRVEETARALLDAGAEVDLRIDPGTDHIITDEAKATTARLFADLAAPTT